MEKIIKVAVIDDDLSLLAYALETLQATQPALDSQGVKIALTVLPKSLRQTRDYVETMILRQQDFLIYNQQHLNNNTATLFGIEKVLPYRLWLREGDGHNSEDYSSLEAALTAAINYIRAIAPAVC